MWIKAFPKEYKSCNNTFFGLVFTNEKRISSCKSAAKICKIPLPARVCAIFFHYCLFIGLIL